MHLGMPMTSEQVGGVMGWRRGVVSVDGCRAFICMVVVVETAHPHLIGTAHSLIMGSVQEGRHAGIRRKTNLTKRAGSRRRVGVMMVGRRILAPNGGHGDGGIWAPTRRRHRLITASHPDDVIMGQRDVRLARGPLADFTGQSHIRPEWWRRHTALHEVKVFVGGTCRLLPPSRVPAAGLIHVPRLFGSS